MTGVQTCALPIWEPYLRIRPDGVWVNRRSPATFLNRTSTPDAAAPDDLDPSADPRWARVSRTSVCGSWGAVAGSLRYFADRFGIPRASIEGTQLSMDLVYQYAERHAPALALDAERKQSPVLLERRVTYHGFELSREREPLPEFPVELADAARTLVADGLPEGRRDRARRR